MVLNAFDAQHVQNVNTINMCIDKHNVCNDSI